MSKKSLILLVVTAFVMSLGLGVSMSLADNDEESDGITIKAYRKSREPNHDQFPEGYQHQIPWLQ